MSFTNNTITFPELIRLKRDGGQFSDADIQVFVQGIKSRTIQDSQIGEHEDDLDVQSHN